MDMQVQSALFRLGLLGAVLAFSPAPCLAVDPKPADSPVDPGISNIAPYLLPGLIPDQGKWVKIARWGDADEARAMVVAGIERAKRAG